MKYVRSLRRRSNRQAERAFVVEGMRAVEDALDAGAGIRQILVRDGDTVAKDIVLLYRIEADVLSVDSKLFNFLTETVAPQGVLAVVDMPTVAIEASQVPLILVLDRPRDPGNLGTLLRTAAAAGVTLVALTDESVDPYNPKVVRAAMGAHFRVAIRDWTEEVERSVLRTCPTRLAAVSGAKRAYDAVDWLGGTALIIGSEAHGVSAEMAALATDHVSIPLAANVESLNAAVAGGVLLFEAARQRRNQASAPA
ncbi:MAG: TrmH family RNA methyltransferase [Thermomicrobiales bacterium]